MGLYNSIEQDRNDKLTDAEYYGNMTVLILLFIIFLVILNYVGLFLLWIVIKALQFLCIL